MGHQNEYRKNGECERIAGDKVAKQETTLKQVGGCGKNTETVGFLQDICNRIEKKMIVRRDWLLTLWNTSMYLNIRALAIEMRPMD